MELGSIGGLENKMASESAGTLGHFGTAISRSFLSFSHVETLPKTLRETSRVSHTTRGDLTSRYFALTVDMDLQPQAPRHGDEVDGARALGAHFKLGNHPNSSQGVNSHRELTDIDCHTCQRLSAAFGGSHVLACVRRLKTQPRAATVSGTSLFVGGAA